jgi:hypothetical protein
VCVSMNREEELTKKCIYGQPRLQLYDLEILNELSNSNAPMLLCTMFKFSICNLFFP